MDYQESLNYLYSLVRLGIKLGLENTQRLLDHFGHPQLKTPTIHIAGTNGKGSTAAFVESVLRASGYRVGLYTSPHILDFRERIQVNRQLISPEEFVHWIAVLKQTSEKLNISPTFFEMGTLLALLHFDRQKTDWNVVEVGMGGRLDATNLCQGQVCIITSISHDHESSLGTHLRQIAQEKAAIIKHPCTVISGTREQEAMAVIQKQCRNHQATLLQLEQDFEVNIQSHSLEKQVFDFNGPEIWYKGLEIELTGRHQSVNAGLAVAACTALNDSAVTEQAIRQGLQSTNWAGRLEVCNEKPSLILDGAHNVDSFRKLTASLSEIFPQKRKIWVFGIMKDKPLAEITELISDFADYIVVTQPKSDRSTPPEQIRKAFADFTRPIVQVDEIPQALDHAYQAAHPDDLIIVTGSLLTVAEAKQVIDNQTHNS